MSEMNLFTVSGDKQALGRPRIIAVLGGFGCRVTSVAG